MKFGVQLYSLRETAEKKGAEEILRMVSEAGYDGVEFAGFYGKTPEEMLALVKKYHLDPISAHIGTHAIEESLPYIDLLGIKYVFIPWESKDVFDEPEKFAELGVRIKKAAAELKKRGVVLGYHNHAHEFEDGKDRLEQLFAAQPALKAELDVFWLTVAQRDPVQYMKKLGERLAMVHIKEAGKNPREDAQPVVGEGIVDMGGVFGQMKVSGIEWAVLEVEHYPCDEEEYLRRSLENMKKLAK